jgi:hypothetical protein
MEMQLLRQSLDVITIAGKDAKTVANLQIKLEKVISDEIKKQEELNQFIAAESNKNT